MTRVTFGGHRSVTIPVGQEIWSDATKLRWVDGDRDDPNLQGRNLAVSYAIAGDSGPMTFHSGANQTSFITAAGSGDHTADLDVFAYEFTTASWFFIDAAEEAGVPLADIGEATVVRLEAALDPGLPPVNPLDAWGTGHAGGCTTLHASDTPGATSPTQKTLGAHARGRWLPQRVRGSPRSAGGAPRSACAPPRSAFPNTRTHTT